MLKLPLLRLLPKPPLAEQPFTDTNKDRKIDDEFYKQNEEVYSYAMDMTTKELDQAVEGMYHNLKHIWVTQ